MPTTKGGASRDIRRYFSAQPTTLPLPKRRTASPGSADGEDPLATDASRLNLPALRPGHAATHDDNNDDNKAAAGRSRIAVVLSASPRRAPPVRQTPVPLPRIPQWNQSSASSPAPASSATTRSSRGKVGRPRGWRPGMPYTTKPAGARPSRAAAAQQQTPGPVPGARRRGRPCKAPSPPPREVYDALRPQFVDFICEWAGCRAELHNLDTLRRHVYVVHGRHALRCRWGRCGAAAEVEDGKEEPVAAAAADPDEFRRHVEERHLVPLAWHVGEGPQNSIAGKGSGGGGECCLNNDSVPDFLKDAHGNQVTPSIRDQQVEDRVTWRMNRRRLKELLLRRDENLPSEELDSLVNDEA